MAITISQEPKRSRDGVEVFFVAVDNGMWFEFEAGAGEIKVAVDVYLADATQVNSSDIVLFFGIDGKVFFDASPYIQPYLNNDNDNTYQSAVETDVNASQGFYLKYAEYPAASPGVFTQSSTYYASKSAKQFGDTYGQNMASYWASSSQVVLAKLLTKVKTLPYWSGFPFSLSYIKSSYIVTANITQLSNTGTELSNVDYPALTDNTIEQVNILSINASAKKLNVSLNDTYIDVYSLLFDGVDEQISCGDVLDVEYTDTFSYSFWIKREAASPSSSIILWKGNAGGFDCFITGASGGLYFRRRGANGNRDVVIGGTLTQSVWYHIVLTCSGGFGASTMKLYIDSVDSGSTLENDLDDNMTNTDPLLFAGNSGFIGSYFNGNLDEISSWNKALSGAEITTLYNGGAPTNPTQHTASANLVGWWAMGEGATYGGGNWTIPDDSTNSNIGTSANMEEADRKLDVPS